MNFLSFLKPSKPSLKDIITDLSKLVDEFENECDTDKQYLQQHKKGYKKVMHELLLNSVNKTLPEVYQYIYGWILARGELEYRNGVEVLTLDMKTTGEYDLFHEIEIKLKNSNYYLDYIEWFIFNRYYFLVVKDRQMINMFKNDKYNSEVTQSKYFCRGFFEGSKPNIISGINGITCKLTSPCITKFYSHYIKKFYGLCSLSKYTYVWYDMDALGFLCELYNLNGNIVTYLDEYTSLPTIVNQIQECKIFNDFRNPPQFICNRLKENASYPYKNVITDTGFTVNLLDKVDEKDGIEYYTTGLQFYSDYGYYFEVYSDNLYKNGYMLATGNSYIIDNNMNEEIIVPLYKYNDVPNSVDMTVKLVPKKLYMCDVKSYQSKSESFKSSSSEVYSDSEDENSESDDES